MPTPEELLAGLRTRGFDSGFQRSPLREFKGKLEKISPNMVDTRRGPKLQYTYHFINLEVMETVEPYPFPIAQISMFDSNREQSNMGVFGRSVDKILNTNIPEDNPTPEQVAQLKGQADMIGATLHIKLTGGHMMWDGDKGEETPRECWELIGIIGVGEADVQTGGRPTIMVPEDKALELLDGKNIQDWNQVVFQNPLVKSDGNLVKQILDNIFIPTMKEKGIVTEDNDGILHVRRD